MPSPVVIPFVSRGLPDDRQDWINQLSLRMPFAMVRDFASCTADERARARVAIVANPEPADVAAMPNLVWVQSLWAGVERLVAELPADGPNIVRLVDPQLAETMAEAVLAWTLYLHRSMPIYRQQQNDRVWRQHRLATARETCVGLLGFGHLGRKAAERLVANGFTVAAWDLSPQPMAGVTPYRGQDGLQAMLASSDIIVLLLPLTSMTRGIIRKETLLHCKSGAAVINFARGGLVVSEDLLAALDSRRISHAVLDVFDVEPLPEDDVFWRRTDVTVLPHISAPTNRSTAAAIASRNIQEFLTNGSVPSAVDRNRGF
jgi:glyoxylate/hydroxypyruvate reductase A